MKILVFVATLTLALQAQQAITDRAVTAPAKMEYSPTITKIDPDALTPAHVAQWQQINQAIGSANAAVSEAKVRQVDANEARQQAEADRRATQQQVEAAIQRMRKEAKCDNCIPEAKPDGSYVWKKPPTE